MSVAIPAMCSMAVLSYLSITSVFDSTLAKPKVHELDCRHIRVDYIGLAFFLHIALRSRSEANHRCNEETLALDGRLVPRAMK